MSSLVITPRRRVPGSAFARVSRVSIADSTMRKQFGLQAERGQRLWVTRIMKSPMLGCSLGFGMGVFPELRMTHLIPKERVSDEYFLRLHEGNQISGALLAYKWLGEIPPNPFSSKSILSLVKNVVLTGGFHRRNHLAIVRGRIAARRAVAKYLKGARMADD